MIHFLKQAGWRGAPSSFEASLLLLWKLLALLTKMITCVQWVKCRIEGILLNRIMWGFDVLITLVYEFLVRYMNYYNVNIHLFHRGTYTLHPGMSLNDFLPKVSVILKNYFWYYTMILQNICNR